MPAYLLAWNPKRWPWGTLAQEMASVRKEGKAQNTWSCGNNKKITVGSRFFLIRLGQEPKGIVGTGRITSQPYLAKHWELDRAKRGEKALFVDIEFDILSEKPLVGWATLQRPPFNAVRWATQMSGIRIPDPTSEALKALLRQRAPERYSQIPEEIGEGQTYHEGAVKKVIVNAYERDSKARAACIQHFGSRCQACGFDFGKKYGPTAAGYIQVHHLKPMADIAEDYKVNPLVDLIPVCPNCHGVIHLQDPPYKLEQVRNLLRAGNRRSKP